MSQPAEQQLVEKAVAGDRAALERLLLDCYEPLLRRIEPRMPPALRGVMGAEDIVQQTFAQVFRDIGKFESRDDASPLAWMTTIAENRLRDAIRNHGRKKRGGDLQRVGGGGAHGEPTSDFIEMISGRGHTPSKSLARREAIQAIQVALAGLPDDYRQAVQLRYFDKHSLEETARLMNRTTGAVRGLLDRAKKKMEEALGRASTYLSTK
jgi:RNA polymerase sigma-70 factor (ECF subfamily)